MSGSTMFNVAYGLECNSNDDPTLIRMEKLTTATIEVGGAAQFLFVSLLLAYVHDKSPDLTSLEYSSSFEACSFLDAWWFVQEGD
jgi:hypothetical protein